MVTGLGAGSLSQHSGPDASRCRSHWSSERGTAWRQHLEIPNPAALSFTEVEEHGQFPIEQAKSPTGPPIGHKLRLTSEKGASLRISNPNTIRGSSEAAGFGQTCVQLILCLCEGLCCDWERRPKSLLADCQSRTGPWLCFSYLFIERNLAAVPSQE